MNVGEDSLKTEIRERIEQIQKGMVPKGYKKSKAGIAPQEWEVGKAKTVFMNYSNKIHNGESTVLSVTQDRGIIPRSEVDKEIPYSESNIGSYKRVEKGNFVISLRSFEGGIEFSGYEGLVSPAYTVIKNHAAIDHGYYKQYFKTETFISKLNSAVYGIRDGKQIGYEDFCNLRIHIPPLSEQKKIAEIISACDKVVELKKKLIARKRQQKRWLLENLLTGEKRLPGFRGKWKEVRLEEVCKDIIGGGTPPRNTKRYYQGSIPWVTVKDLDGAKQKYDSVEHISPDAVVDRTTRIIPKGNLIVSTRMGLGRGFINMVDMAINQDMKGIILDNALVSTEFVYFSYIELHDLLERLGNGSTVKGIDVQTLKKLKINLPPLPEQTAIAEILSAADREIGLHERHLEELKKQKKALMQLLLTGIVRVNGQEVS